MTAKTEWAAQEETIILKKQLRQDKQDILNHWSVGGYTEETDSGTAQLNAQALGKVEAIDQILGWIDADEETEDGYEMGSHGV